MQRSVRVLGKVVGGIVAVLLVAYLATNLWGALRASQLRGEVSARVSERLQTEVPEFWDVSVQTANILGTPDMSWTAQVCDFPTDDAGWIVQTYHQRCVLERVAVFPAASEARALALLERVPTGLSGDAAPPPADGSPTCRTLRESSGPDGASVRSQWVPPQAAGEPSWCGRALEPWGPYQTVAGRMAPLDPTVGALVISRRVHLDTTEIGCSRWSVLYCGNPFGDPAFGSLR